MAGTTKRMPAVIAHLTRENVLCNSPLFRDWNRRWSKWVLAMTPNSRRHFKIRASGAGYRIKKKALKSKFRNQKYSCGIYEWKAKNTSTKEEYVAYIGSTCTSKRGNFITRIYQYCSDGSHKFMHIDQALTKGYKLWVRFKGSGTRDGRRTKKNKESAEDDENRVLKFYHYAWNIRSVKQIHRTLP